MRLIDADALIKDVYVQSDDDGWFVSTAQDLEELVNSQPTADVVPVRLGRWIHDGSRWANRWVCSECGYRWFFECSHGAFCPNCGASMTEGAEDAK